MPSALPEMPATDPESGVVPVGQEWLDALDADVPQPEPVHVNGHGGGGGGKLRVYARPEVKLGKDVHRVIHEVQEALSKDPLVYQRAHRLVTVVGAKHRKGAPIIRELVKDSLLPRLSRHVKCMRAAKPDKLAAVMPVAPPLEWEECVAPPLVTGPLLACADWPDMRELTGISVTPIFRPDGSIWQEPGYDEATGVLYAPSADYPEVPSKPGRDEAAACLEALREVCCDFPFAAPHHESAWLAGVLTSLARAAIDGPVPLFAVDASTRGTGKSRLVDAAMLLCHGESAARMPLPEDDDEMRKRISALLSEGAAGILLDNINCTIALPSLDAVLTADVWADRVLGSTTSLKVPARAVWWATGNNIQLGGDLSRRTLHIRLESSLENPEERSGFRHPDLLTWVRDNRRRLVACGLTMLRAAVVARVIPNRETLWGSYESWSSIVPPVLAWLGMPSVFVARASIEAAMDEEKLALATLIDGLRRLCPIRDADRGIEPISARTIVDTLYPSGGTTGPDGYEALRDALEQETRTMAGKRPEVRRVGKWLQRVRGRVVDGWSVQRHDGRNHTAVWRAEPITGYT